MDNILMRLSLQIRETYQNTRLEAWNDIRNYIRKKDLGLDYSEVEKKKEKKTFDKNYADAKLPEVWNNLLKENKINEIEHESLKKLLEAMKKEDSIDKLVTRVLGEFIKNNPIYINFLSKIRGIGPIYSAKLISYLGDCGKFDTVSKLWAYTGNHVIDGKAPKRRKGQDANWNHILRTLTWQISDNFVRQNKGYYRKKYDEEKERQLNRVYIIGELHKKYPGKKKNGKDIYSDSTIHISKGHAHNRAMRKIRKHFLSHYWECAREVNGLPTKKTYVEGVMNHEHIIGWKEALKMEGCLLAK